jgi:hypothetical protein
MLEKEEKPLTNINEANSKIKSQAAIIRKMNVNLEDALKQAKREANLNEELKSQNVSL